MFAVVARTFGTCGPFRLRSRRVRVTHTLLCIAALAVSPGVCGACARGCLDRAGESPTAGIACAVAANRGHGSCCGTMDEPSNGSQRPVGPPTTPADAADGILNFSTCCGDGPGCECRLAPREDPSAVLKPCETVEPASWEALVGTIGPSAREQNTLAVRSLPERPPSRPVRVLYGVWRN